jgi:hypothetical protein
LDSQNEQYRAQEGDEACLGTAATGRTLAQVTELPDRLPERLLPPFAHPPRVCAQQDLSLDGDLAAYAIDKEGHKIGELLCAAAAHALQLRRVDFNVTIDHS